MNGDSDDMMLGAYTMGVLDPDEARYVEAHLSGCAACRHELAEFVKMRELLGQVPPEAFLDGPPPADTDLVLRRTLRDAQAERSQAERSQAERSQAERSQVERSQVERSQVERSRATRQPRRRRPILMAVAAAAVVGVTGLGAGVLIGHQDDHATRSATTLPGGARTVNATDAATGAKLEATVIPAGGWVRVKVRMQGVAAGTPCRMIVLSRDGTEHQAGSWRTSPSGATPEVDGSALVAPREVAAVEVQRLSGERLVTARF
jgi:anti-sigma factor RsiW